MPSPAQELTEWWLDLEPPVEEVVVVDRYPSDHDLYLRELYDEITTLRARVRGLEEELAASRRGEREAA